MKEEKVPKMEGTDLHYSMQNAYWQFDVGEIVLMRIFTPVGENGKDFIDTPVNVVGVTFRGMEGPPMVTIEFANKWNSGEWGGAINMTLMLGRYVSPETLTEQHINIFSSHPDAKSLYYIEERDGEHYKIFPFLKE